MNQNELHQFEHIMTHSPSFDHLFGQTTYTATYFRIIRSGESNYVIIEKKIEMMENVLDIPPKDESTGMSKPRIG